MIVLADPDVEIRCGDALEILRELPDRSVHMCVTSPPFLGLRDYGVAGQIGLEALPDDWVARLVEVFREVRRVLRYDGTLWVECGDSYNSSPRGNAPGDLSSSSLTNPERQDNLGRGSKRVLPGLKPKDLLGTSWRLAFALQADGWYLRSCIVWHRPNPMPESVRDRPTTAHSYLFLLSRQPRYFYDGHAIAEPSAYEGDVVRTHGAEGMDAGYDGHRTRDGFRRGVTVGPTRNARSVWTIPTEPQSLAICPRCWAFWDRDPPRTHCGGPVVQHFAAFPQALAERCIKAGCPPIVCSACYTPQVNGQHGNLSESEATQANVRRVRGLLRRDEPEVLQPSLQQSGEGPNPVQAAPGLQTLRPTSQANESSVLFNEMLWAVGDSDRSESAALPTRTSGSELEGGAGDRSGRLRSDLATRNGLSSRASSCDGASSQAIIAAERIRPSSEWGQGGQSAGEPRTDDTQPSPRDGKVPALWGVLRYSVSSCCNAPLTSGIVLDPFLGSGTTAVVARRLGRRCIGIDLSEPYARMAAARLAQLSLLAEATT